MPSPRFLVAEPPGVPPSLPLELADSAVIPIRPWVDPVIDTLGFDPRSAYVERFWLGILGPSTTWLLRRVAAALDSAPDGFDLPVPDTARELGLGERAGRHSPFMRALWRCHQFDLARYDDGVFQVRRRLPPLNRRQLHRLPDSIQAAHERWNAGRLGDAPAEAERRRARSLALILLEIDPDAAGVEARLAGLGIRPGLAADATGWAWDRHAHAAAAAEAATAS